MGTFMATASMESNAIAMKRAYYLFLLSWKAIRSNALKLKDPGSIPILVGANTTQSIMSAWVKRAY